MLPFTFFGDNPLPTLQGFSVILISHFSCSFVFLIFEAKKDTAFFKLSDSFNLDWPMFCFVSFFLFSANRVSSVSLSSRPDGAREVRSERRRYSAYSDKFRQIQVHKVDIVKYI